MQPPARRRNGQDPNNPQDPKKKKGFFGKIAGIFKDDKSAAPVSKPPDRAADGAALRDQAWDSAWDPDLNGYWLL